MKLSEYIQALQQIKGNPDVILSSDEEGNSFKLAHQDFSLVKYTMDGFLCELYDEDEMDDEWNGYEYAPGDPPNDIKDGIIIWPIG